MKRAIPLVVIIIVVVGGVSLMLHLSLGRGETEEGVIISAEEAAARAVYDRANEVGLSAAKKAGLTQSQLDGKTAEGMEAAKRDISAALRHVVDNLGVISPESFRADEKTYLECLGNSAYLFYLLDSKNEAAESGSEADNSDLGKLTGFFSEVHTYLSDIETAENSAAAREKLGKELAAIEENWDAYVEDLVRSVS
jgi:hypothetical protein